MALRCCYMETTGAAMSGFMPGGPSRLHGGVLTHGEPAMRSTRCRLGVQVKTQHERVASIRIVATASAYPAETRSFIERAGGLVRDRDFQEHRVCACLSGTLDRL